jgi:hypothetical protein
MQREAAPLRHVTMDLFGGEAGGQFVVPGADQFHKLLSVMPCLSNFMRVTLLC